VDLGIIFNALPQWGIVTGFFGGTSSEKDSDITATTAGDQPDSGDVTAA
jgi:hypothetical protein